MADYTSEDIGKVLYHIEYGLCTVVAVDDSTYTDRPLKVDTGVVGYQYFTAEGRLLPSDNTIALYYNKLKIDQTDLSTGTQGNTCELLTRAVDSTVVVSNDPTMASANNVVRKFHSYEDACIRVYSNGGSSLTTDDTELFGYWDGCTEFPPIPPASGESSLVGQLHFMSKPYDEYTPWHLTLEDGTMLANDDDEFVGYPVKVGFPDADGTVLYFDMVGRNKDEYKKVQTLFFYELWDSSHTLPKIIIPDVDTLLKVWDLDENKAVLRYFAALGDIKAIKVYAAGQDSNTTDGTYEEYMNYAYL